MKFIKGYENLYSVKEDGNIYSHFSGRNMAGDINSCGYRRVILCKDKKRNRQFVHRLIAEAYIQNPENKRTVNHKDGNKLNNSFENLEWNTMQENNLHRWEKGLMRVTENFIQETKRKIPKDYAKVLVDKYKNKKLCVAKEAEKFGVTVSAIYSTIYRNIK